MFLLYLGIHVNRLRIYYKIKFGTDQVTTVRLDVSPLLSFYARRWRILCWFSSDPQRKGQQEQGGLLLSSEEGTIIVPFQLNAGFLPLQSGEMLFPKKIEMNLFSVECGEFSTSLPLRNSRS